jgi:very-short-patch-repair endonuclease
VPEERGGADPVRQYRLILGGHAYRVDSAWPGPRLAVEIDGAAVHGAGQLSSDLRRQNAIVMDGWVILRFTWQMVVARRDLVTPALLRAWETRSITARWR